MKKGREDENGCTAAARTVHATLATLSTTLKRARITNPAMLFIRYPARARAPTATAAEGREESAALVSS